jgi:protein Mpv17
LDAAHGAKSDEDGPSSTTGLSGRHVAASAAYGAVVVGPLGHAWYRFLDAWVAARAPRGSARFVAAKVLLDEIVFGPIHVAGFFAAVAVAEDGGFNLGALSDKLRRDFWPTYAAELAFWPAFQAFNFARVPLRHQLLVVNLACLLDATFLCWVSRRTGWGEGLVAAVTGGGGRGGEDPLLVADGGGGGGGGGEQRRARRP